MKLNQYKLLIIIICVVSSIGCTEEGNQSSKEEISSNVRVQPTECDLLAAAPADPLKVSDGVNFDSLNSDKALVACKASIDTYPDETRFMFQYGRALDKSGNYNDALTWYQKAADRGYAAAFYSMALMYSNGNAEESTEVVSWLQWAPRGALYQVSNSDSYEKGNDQEAISREAMKWFKREVEKGAVGALIIVGYRLSDREQVEKNYAEAVSWFQKSADLGDKDAAMLLGNIYMISVNYETAIKWFQKADQLGHAEAKDKIRNAALTVGNIYEAGLIHEKNYETAIKWFQKADQLGLVEAKDKIRNVRLKLAKENSEKIMAQKPKELTGTWRCQTTNGDGSISEDIFTFGADDKVSLNAGGSIITGTYIRNKSAIDMRMTHMSSVGQINAQIYGEISSLTENSLSLKTKTNNVVARQSDCKLAVNTGSKVSSAAQSEYKDITAQYIMGLADQLRTTRKNTCVIYAGHLDNVADNGLPGSIRRKQADKIFDAAYNKGCY